MIGSKGGGNNLGTLAEANQARRALAGFVHALPARLPGLYISFTTFRCPRRSVARTHYA